jgi:hypothetical protein
MRLKKYGHTQTIYFPKIVWLKLQEEIKKSDRPKPTVNSIVTDALRKRYGVE